MGTPPLGYLLTTCGRLVLPRLLGHHVPFSLDPLSLPIYCPEKSGALNGPRDEVLVPRLVLGDGRGASGVAEAALAHKVHSQAEAAYARSDLTAPEARSHGGLGRVSRWRALRPGGWTGSPRRWLMTGYLS